MQRRGSSGEEIGKDRVSPRLVRSFTSFFPEALYPEDIPPFSKPHRRAKHLLLSVGLRRLGHLHTQAKSRWDVVTEALEASHQGRKRCLWVIVWSGLGHPGQQAPWRCGQRRRGIDRARWSHWACPVNLAKVGAMFPESASLWGSGSDWAQEDFAWIWMVAVKSRHSSWREAVVVRGNR